jgi:hypothetical protein
LQTDAQPLRFLDFLIYDAEPAVFLHDAGVLVNVPAPQRYALHKLIISNRRREGAAKRDKDVRQAEALLEVLCEKRPRELKLVWEEVDERGEKWRAYLIEGLSDLRPIVRDSVLKIATHTRNLITGIDLTFDDPPPAYDFSREVVTFNGESMGKSVPCAISREALDDNFGTSDLNQQGCLDAFRKNRAIIEIMARIKYLSWPIEKPGSILIKTTDLPKLLTQAKNG